MLAFLKRMTDELTVLLFEIRWFNINSITEDFIYTDDEEAIIADAEKAFVSMLDAKYNEIKFNNYPKGGDCIYVQGDDVEILKVDN